MGHTKRASKGDVSISSCRGWIRLRWRYAGERYSLNLPHRYLPENMHYAAITAAEIKLDIAKGCFDPTLEKYNPIPSRASPPKPQTAPPILPGQRSDNNTIPLIDLVKHFNDWGTNVRNINIDNTTYYLAARRFLKKCKGIPWDQMPLKLNQEKWSVSTYNERLSLLKSFFSWLIDAEIIPKNPLKGVCRKKNKRKRKNPKRMPLEENEIIQLLEAVKHDTYCPPASNFKHSFYYPFLVFVFYTGVRNAEAIGLRIKHVDLSNKRVEISEAYARTIKGSNHSARIQKGTKTENSRLLPLMDELVELLSVQVQNKKPNDFVFSSPKGKSIDDRMLQRRVLKPVLKKLGLEDRDLYAARHSFGTRAVQQGMALTDVAYLMGHTTVETAMRNYVSVSKPAVTLPLVRKKDNQET
jgi:integrase